MPVVQRSVNGRPQIHEHVPALLAAGVNDALEVGGEHVATVALAAEARLSPSDQTAHLTFGMIVRGFNRGIVDEAPQRLAVFDNVVTRSADATDG